MIVSASYRTDIPAFYGDWFEKRLNAGSVRVANPYGGRDYEVSLRPEDVAGYVFWTRNMAPFGPVLDRIRRDGVPFAVQYTATGYPRALETSTIGTDVAVRQMQEIAGRFGGDTVVWRYDPIVMTDLTSPAWHAETFAGFAAALEGVTDEVTVSFATIYAKTRRNMDANAAQHGFTWRDPAYNEKIELLQQLKEIAAQHEMALTVCAQPDLEKAAGPGVAPAACIDAARLSRVAGQPVSARQKGNRPGCLCHEARDIGAYDTCPHGCAYCYAVRRPHAAKRSHAAHDPASSRLTHA